MNRIEEQIKNNKKKLKSDLNLQATLQARVTSQQARKNLKRLSSSSVQTLTKVAYQHDKYNKQTRYNIRKGAING